MLNPKKTRRQPAIHCVGATDRGQQRDNNEDTFGIFHNDATGEWILFVVDGMGGQAAGEVAAEIAREKLRARLEQPVGLVETRIKQAIAMANNAIYDRAETNEELRGMACVLTVAVVEEDGQVTIGHVGDTRLYKLQLGVREDERIKKLTHDHSPVGEREDAGDLVEEEAMRHPRRNEVFRDVGSQRRETDTPEFIEITQTRLEPHSALLLCSDGLSDLLTKKQIREIVEENRIRPDRVVEQLIKAANEAGGKDNITVVFAAGKQYVSKSPRIVQETREEYDDDAPTRAQGAVEAAASGVVAQASWWNRKKPPLHDPDYSPEQNYPSEPQARPAVYQPSGYVPTYLQRPRSPGSDERALAVNQSSGEISGGKVSMPLPLGGDQKPGARSGNPLKAVVAGLLLGAVLLVIFFKGVAPIWLDKPPAPPPPSPLPANTNTWLVGPGQNRELKKISDALQRAKDGDTIFVDPGWYSERLILKDGVNLICDKEGGATVALPLSSTDDQAVVVADGLSKGRFEGFRIKGAEDPASAESLRIGIQITNSKITIANVEISNAKEAAIFVGGSSDVEIIKSKIRDNPGTGVLATGDSKVYLTSDVILDRNGSNTDRQGKAEIIPKTAAAGSALMRNYR